MKLMVVVLTTAGILAAAPRPAAIEPADRSSVTICMNRRGDYKIFRAQQIASQVFKQIGVRVDWRNENSACPPSGNGIEITYSDQAPASERPGSLAYSMPYQGNKIVLYYDRLMTTASRMAEPNRLGYVLAHEIAHVLQRIARHSDSGIMKSKWDGRDYAEMRTITLGFSHDDVQLIRQGLLASSIQSSNHDGSVANEAQSQ
jgi:hypothetical protein